MRVLVIGGSGLIGSYLVHECRTSGIDVLSVGHSNGNLADILVDITDKNSLKRLGRLESTDVVFHLAAVGNPNLVFNNPNEAEMVNVEGAKNVFEYCSASGARVFFMSSIEVFNGQEHIYSEDAPTCPLNLYGKQKAEVERLIGAHYHNVSILRTSWNIGFVNFGRCVVQLTYESLLRPNCRMANDNFFTVASASETARNMVNLLDKPVFAKLHLAGKEVICRSELAMRIVERSKFGDRMAFKKCAFDDIQFAEPRSRLNVLDNSLSINSFGAEYSDSWSVIDKKIEYLDEFLA